MENVRIIDLKVDNIVQFQAPFKGITAMQTAIVIVCMQKKYY